jgi:catechol 2,3-dioxygenase-like lactoylglutathione lyase family enzyme
MIRGGLVTLPVGDVRAAVRFYVETLGMKLIDEPEGEAAILDAGEGFAIALRPGAARLPEGTLTLRAKVPIDEAIAIYENRGVTFFEVERKERGTIARFRDPDGNLLALA